MSLVAISLNLLLAGLLVAALFIGIRLERRLKGVRDGQLAFAQAVADLDASAIKARQGLAELRAASDEATDTLGGRIARARDAADRLETLVRRAESASAYAPPPKAAPEPSGPEGGLAALLKQLKESEGLISPPQSEAIRAGVAARQAAPVERPLRLYRSADDDLFDDAGARA